MIEGIIYSILNYLIGSVSSAILIAKYIGKKDIRKSGDKKAGGSNVAKEVGLKWGIAVGLFDFFKGIPLVLLAKYLELDFFWIVVIANMSIIGHCWPVWFHLSGGRGVATYLGVLLAVFPKAGIYSLIIMALSIPAKPLRTLIEKHFRIRIELLSSAIATLGALLFVVIITWLKNEMDIFAFSFTSMVIILFRRVTARIQDYKDRETIKLFLSRILLDNSNLFK